MNAQKMLARKPKTWIMNSIFTTILLVAVILSFQGSSINMLRLQTIGVNLRIIGKQLINLNIDFLIGRGVYAFEEGVIYLTIETLAIGFLGTLVGAILALPFSFLASKNIVGIKVAKIGEAILVMIRVFPEVILALVIVKGFGMNALTGMLTIGIHSIGMLGKLFSETIDNMDKSSLEALEAVGATTITKIRYGIMPQIMADLSSITLYRLDINVRSATVLGIVGAGGLGASMILSAENSNWDILGTIMVAIIVMVLTVDAISSHLRSKLV
ncbi:MAG: phosphonate ABC transporter, permease protein PhnE [Tenericutes bacterium GWC2_34_14]|nr:MAG: phosphonate ABC transporter, permease protein PhnE [Tenericutes bacterium GWC2_34_14]OHE33339.1 MAG: phosphonate ABC transporter, permease protein PhnE [Tenericutes bacterium GWE2_34_108]OHE36490.1 MAG: phosphonate ABC transporter, permease protein PhnE [Tenericutes bacterium GWF1_35_14]OHE37694.1 MAG: phosphonate ABC transporter, permease protein PhnE [Tenericutes bacterium GWF2_35_184]OHE45156.1 MAG: phosphonate ABC transporter, permease protein PhnE [Tenericutes bacterium RIFOXYA2_FU